MELKGEMVCGLGSLIKVCELRRYMLKLRLIVKITRFSYVEQSKVDRCYCILKSGRAT